MTLFASKPPVITPEQTGSVEVTSRDELSRCPHWARAFASKRKDHRYYEIVEETILQRFEYRYFAIKDEQGEVRAVQPFFIHDEDLLEGVSPSECASAPLGGSFLPFQIYRLAGRRGTE